ncbi:MAG: PLDc N-terminal domain-containing protein [Patescibacteria group bacterium]
MAGLGFGLAALVFVIGIIAFIFWLMMLIHAIKHPIEYKPVWILVLLLTGLLGAIIYYFAVKRRTPSLAPAQTVVTPPTPPGPTAM